MDTSRLSVWSLAIFLALGGPVLALTAEAINTASFTADAAKNAPVRDGLAAGDRKPGRDAGRREDAKSHRDARSHRDTKSRKDAGKPQALIVKVQVLLARRSISPGEIDGMDGENYHKAIAQFRRQNSLGEGDQLDEQTWTALGGPTAGDIVTDYQLTKKDTSARFPRSIPRDYAKQAKMKKLDYTSPEEMFAERFHMSKGLLQVLNPGLKTRKPGDRILVVSIAHGKPNVKVERVEAVKATGMLVVYGANDAILASYPATIGSADTPSPEGEHTVRRIVFNPPYYYDPEKNFQQGRNKKKLVLPSGPNNPVGAVWIALSKETFGIHGTPEPAQVSKSSSHGCVRLTNWDAMELADMLKPGVKVRFVEQTGS
ncbi:L,D-transpeptidase family protein [Azorhizobium doebereinerae]|uniref:L,D-transpeptidase family protein n=1 Tax=Azorhizobium doebereinerae TaxID=281091 RepID=UPI00040C93C9|nr:L,D-transpeptidase [Azorhizobium doebereinerae]